MSAGLGPTVGAAAGPTIHSSSGSAMAAEIAEQPQVLQRLLDHRAEIAQVRDAITAFQPRFVLFVARGTSDHAALYGKYLAEIHGQKPAGLVSASTITAYGSEPQLHDVLLVAVSQSGGSPDLVECVRAGRRLGARTVTVSNNPESALAQAADLHVDVRAGAEHAVAATKSYLAQLLALNLLFANQPADQVGVEQLPELVEHSITISRTQIPELVSRLRYAHRMVTTGRGYSYPSAREGALKLMETSYLSAQAFSAADLLHGPVAMLSTDIPVIAMQGSGPGGRSLEQVLQRVQQVGSETFVISTAGGEQPPVAGISLPRVPETLAPLLEIVPLQILALELARARGYDPDQPRGLYKVTQTL